MDDSTFEDQISALTSLVVKAAVATVLGFAFRVTIIVCLLALVFRFVVNELDWFIDDTDYDGWRRSGLRVYTDYGTGVQYLSDGHGGLTVRLPTPPMTPYFVSADAQPN